MYTTKKTYYADTECNLYTKKKTHSVLFLGKFCYSAGATEADPTHLHPQQKNLRMAQ